MESESRFSSCFDLLVLQRLLFYNSSLLSFSLSCSLSALLTILNLEAPPRSPGAPATGPWGASERRAICFKVSWERALMSSSVMKPFPSGSRNSWKISEVSLWILSTSSSSSSNKSSSRTENCLSVKISVCEKKKPKRYIFSIVACMSICLSVSLRVS